VNGTFVYSICNYKHARGADTWETIMIRTPSKLQLFIEKILTTISDIYATKECSITTLMPLYITQIIPRVTPASKVNTVNLLKSADRIEKGYIQYPIPSNFNNDPDIGVSILALGSHIWAPRIRNFTKIVKTV